MKKARRFIKYKKLLKKGLDVFLWILKKILIIVAWGILYILLTVFTYDEYSSSIPVFIVLFVYFILLQNYYQQTKQYDIWCKSSEYDDYYKRFCRKYYPRFWLPFIVYALGLKFCNSFEFLLSIALTLSIDTNDRRFYTNETNLEIIREMLKKGDK